MKDNEVSNLQRGTEKYGKRAEKVEDRRQVVL
jgi:hypothetical protein